MLPIRCSEYLPQKHICLFVAIITIATYAVVTKLKPLHTYTTISKVIERWQQNETYVRRPDYMQTVSGTSFKFLVFSAYFDKRHPLTPAVRVVGVSRTKNREQVWCQMHYGEQTYGIFDNKILPTVVKAHVQIIRENWGMDYSACFVMCPLPPGQVMAPPFVSIVSAPDRAVVTNRLYVHDYRIGTGSVTVTSKDVGVCVQPIHGRYPKLIDTLEFLELYRILGIRHVTFYNHSITEKVGCILNTYIDEGFVEVLQWHLDLKSDVEIRTVGIFVALNDCLYRNMNRFQLLMFVDTDEFIIPHKHYTIPEMLTSIDEKQAISNYMFLNSFFNLELADDLASKNTPSLRSLRKSRRQTKFFPPKERSKYICHPRRIKEVGNHFIWEFLVGGSMVVPTDVAYVHHYRVITNDKSGDTVSDQTAFKYKDDLVGNVTKVIRRISRRCELNDMKNNY